MKKSSFNSKAGKAWKALAGLNLSYAGSSLKPEKKGEDAYGIGQGRQVVEIRSFPFETSAKTKESFENTAAGLGSSVMPWIMSTASQTTSLRAGFLAAHMAASVAFGLVIVSYRRF